MIGANIMNYEVKENIPTITEFGNELKVVCDAYWRRAITMDEFKDIILNYAAQNPEKIYKGEELNMTVRIILGVKRTALVSSILEEN